MAEVQIKLEIQDEKGSAVKRVTIAVSESITKAQLTAGIKSNFGDLFKSEDIEVLFDIPDNHPILGKTIAEGTRVIARPKSSASFFRVVDG